MAGGSGPRTRTTVQQPAQHTSEISADATRQEHIFTSTHQNLIHLAVVRVSLIIGPDLDAEHAEDPMRGRARGENGTRGHAILGTYRHETPHPMTRAPIVLPIVGGTDPTFMI